jgi:hypothetical protein
MDTRLEKKFDEIAREAIRKAELVDCSLEDFARGIWSIYHELKTRLELAIDETGLRDELYF